MPKTEAHAGGFSRFWRRFVQVCRFVLLGTLLACAIIWCVGNRQPVEISFMPFAYGLEMPLFLLVLIVFTLAYALAALQAVFQQLHLKTRIKQLQNHLQAVDASQHQQQLSERLHQETRRDAQDEEFSWPENTTESTLPPLPVH